MERAHPLVVHVPIALLLTSVLTGLQAETVAKHSFEIWQVRKS